MANAFIVNNISLSLDEAPESCFDVARQRLKKLAPVPNDAAFSIYRRSIDARKKNSIKLVYSVLVSGSFSKKAQAAFARNGISELCDSTPDISYGDVTLKKRPLVVGAGPAGMFAALMLAEHGYRPILIERGGTVSERVEKNNAFKATGSLDTDTNIQFGAGGAGTFSDGKLVTRINDKYSNYILERLVEFGAPEEIKYMAKPHIGTDYLCRVVENIMARIQKMGGELHYHTRLVGVSKEKDGTLKALTNTGDFDCSLVILAIGHSARDTYEMLISDGYAIEAKPFSVGVRIEHLRSDIDFALYGEYASHPALTKGEYALSADTDTRGVYTFCMCPGGEVVAAASEYGGVVVNGMSHHARDGVNSNSAVVVSVRRDDYGNTPEKAIEFQRMIERAAYRAGGKNYNAPVCTVGDFLSDKCGTEPTKVLPTYMGGSKYSLSSPTSYLPQFVCASLKRGLLAFDKKISGFASDCALLTGAETRTSAPVRILRGEDGTALGKDFLYPCGEGAGYAGGITSAAIDGLRTAIKVMQRYKPYEK